MSVKKELKMVWGKIWSWLINDKLDLSTEPEQAESTEPEKAETVQADANDAIPFKDLSFCWGGFDGKNAVLSSIPRIQNLKVENNGLSYSWSTGGCEQLGASDKYDYSKTLACLFVKQGDKWVGGKFDWISTSRTSRDFTNIKNGYNGWDQNAVSAGKDFAFVIVSSNGKSRTNITTYSR